MADINEIAALLHVEEKLRAHGNKFQNLLGHVRAALDRHEADHAPKEAEPEPVKEEPTSPKALAPDGEARRPT